MASEGERIQKKLPAHASDIGRKMSKIVKYFDIKSGALEGECKICRSLPDILAPKIIKFTKKSKTNLQDHIEKMHGAMSEAAVDTIIGYVPIQKAFFGLPDYPKQTKVTDSIVDFVIDTHQPIHLVERPSFRKVLAIATSRC